MEACTRTADAWRHAEVLLQMVGSLAVKGLNHPEKLVIFLVQVLGPPIEPPVISGVEISHVFSAIYLENSIILIGLLMSWLLKCL